MQIDFAQASQSVPASIAAVVAEQKLYHAEITADAPSRIVAQLVDKDRVHLRGMKVIDDI